MSSLIKAIESLSNAIITSETVESDYSTEIFYLLETVRASVILHVEYTYELSWKMMKKFIEIDQWWNRELYKERSL
ncbi:MAG: nucleotidyltransferase substrate binding protein [Methanobrevibacter sp.]|nr:nucleotidyltransferase substrate binding protein [Methanobrevibacter sp.]